MIQIKSILVLRVPKKVRDELEIKTNDDFLLKSDEFGRLIFEPINKNGMGENGNQTFHSQKPFSHCHQGMEPQEAL
jgi:bifunctional DNA-binding transcriptional regulator/antitoxin component of YhaV-PrlF toxin-antitoxin module